MNILNLKPVMSLSICLMLLAGCQPQSDSSTGGGNVPQTGNNAKPVPEHHNESGNSSDAQELIPPSMLAKELSLNFVKESTLNTYSIRVQSNLNIHDYEVYRSLDEKEQGELVKVRDSVKDIFIEKADSRTYLDRYVYYTVIVDQEVVRKTRFHIKADLVIEGDFYVSNRLPDNSYHLASVLLKNRARLFIEQTDISFVTDLFESENGEILSFNPESVNSKNGLDALNAGKVSIKASLIRGNLKIDLRGANGLKGAAGVASTQQGGKGKPGVAETTVDILQCVPSVYRGVGPEVSLGRDCSKYLSCATAATSGGQGEPGGQGGPGKRGGSAGHGGHFQLYADVADLFFLDYDVSAGLPGEAGDGGAGGPGGPGGDPGPRGRYCPWTAKVGAVGLPGLSGDKGPSGAEGINGTTDIEVKSMHLKLNDVKGRI